MVEGACLWAYDGIAGLAWLAVDRGRALGDVHQGRIARIDGGRSVHDIDAAASLAAADHEVEVACRAASQRHIDMRFACEGEWHAECGQRVLAIAVQRHRETVALQQYDHAVDAGETGERRCRVDIGDAHAPEEVIHCRTGGFDGDLTGDAEAVLPRDGLQFVEADNRHATRSMSRAKGGSARSMPVP